MPQLLAEHEIKLEWRDFDAAWRTEGRRRERAQGTRARTPGVHLSGIIHGALQLMGELSADDRKDEMPLSVYLGRCWEAGAVCLWPKMTWQPGELERDGVHGTPDGESRGEDVAGLALKGERVLEEFKYTLKSRWNHGDVLREKLWMWQLAAYCWMGGWEYARLHVCWACGDYRPPSPRYVTYLIEFGRGELEEHWRNVILNNKELAEVED